MTHILGLGSGCIWFQYLGAAQMSVQSMRPAVLKSPFFTVAPNDLRLYSELYEKVSLFSMLQVQSDVSRHPDHSSL